MRVCVSALLMTLAAAGSAAAQSQPLVISNWDAYMPKDALERFKAETGIEAVLSIHATNEEIMGKMIANKGAGTDVVILSGHFAQILDKQGLLAKLDHGNIPNLANLYPEAAQMKHDPGNVFSVPYAWGTTGLCYRADLVPAAPTSWKDLLQPVDALKGKVTMLATDRWLLAAGFLAQGLSVNETDPAKLEATQALLTEAKKTLLAYDDTTFYSKLVSGEAVMTQAWDGWCNYGTAENPEIKYVIPAEGSDLWADVMTVSAASTRKADAEKFIDFMLKPENGAWIVENIMYKVPNKAAMDAVPEALKTQFPNLAMTPAELMKYEQLIDVGPATRDYSRVVSAVVNAP